MVDSQIHCIIDNGSGFIKAGYSGEESPRFNFPTIVGKTKVEEVYVGDEKKESIIGEEAQQKFGILDINYPIVEGQIQNWENMQKIWHHTFYSILKISPEEHNILLTESPLNSREERERIQEVMFETFNVPCFYLTSQSALAAFSVGKSTGIVVDCGEGCTNLVPLYEGFLYKGAAKKMPIAGKRIHEIFIKLLTENGQIFQSKMEKEYAKKAKIDYCYICQNFQDELDSPNGDTVNEFELPDKRKIKIGIEKFEAPEALFNPGKFGFKCNSLQQEMMEALKCVDNDIREDFLKNIIFNGGTSLLKGFKERAQKEINDVSTHYECVKKVHFYPEAVYMSWIGGSILTALNSFENLWITKSEYKEYGSNIIHRKCP